ncbi:glycosyl transferase, family 2 [Rhizorhabdus wittichii RW1]|uniref:Glycosyl transferase, family 2 n=1 Tax=Rhizorhabdus wittichii (strain DSM 6014 / CCUG 31198 / JCM 15750 / NBRC 105917 / EY 4224 / RW1) TaxID=392499 RepID=A0A9J9HFV9_RHIWR|nr:glycosyl transferase, family 2 [Rhizorhabdus wittichii RW1]
MTNRIAEPPPTVSIIMACFNAAPWLRASVRSALDQSLRDIELIVVDDGSQDGSVAIGRELAAGDRRVQFHRMARNGGPAAARNHALDMASGRFVAILDSDDLMHPDRLKRLVAVADAIESDIVADDLVVFDDADGSPPEGFFRGARARRGEWITLADYFRETLLYGRMPNLGFLKPLIRRELIEGNGIRYDEGLRIAEDDALIVQLLRAGARYRTIPDAGYFYRKHGSSISHRLSRADVETMVMAGDRLAADLRDAPADVRRALARRNRSIRAARDFTLAIEAIKARRPVAAAGLMLGRPRSIPLFRMPIAARIGRLAGRGRDEAPAPPAPAATAPRVCFISNQRLIGATNGSSAYLIDLARATRAAGREPHLVQPSPAIFGRLPFFRLRPEMAVFASHHVRGAWRVGGWLVARDPHVHLGAAIGIARRVARRVGIAARWTLDRPAPYAVAAPWTKADQLFVTGHARPRADIVVADYMFQSRAFPFVARPGTPTAIVMHDLFHARSEGFAATGGGDSVAAIGRDAELALLGRGDAVIAIQQAEAAFVRRELPDSEVILAPMAAEPVAAPQPGETDRLLFVGSNTAPNVHGLRWFFERVWPAIRAARPAAVLDVAGSVASSFPQGGPAGVRFLGLVDDLAPLYAGAGVVISPLIQGSGLKIKLIEALAQGKATVATGVTLQGVEEIASQAVAKADDPIPFADAVIGLMQAEAERATLAAKALDTARVHFSGDACYRAYRNWLAKITTGLSQVSNEEARICA